MDLLAIVTTPDARSRCEFLPFGPDQSCGRGRTNGFFVVQGDAMFEQGKLVEVLDEYHGVELGYAAAKAVWPTRSVTIFLTAETGGEMACLCSPSFSFFHCGPVPVTLLSWW